MASKPIAEMTTEELKKTGKSLKIATSILCGVLVVMVASSIYLFIDKGFSASTIMPFVFLPLFILNLANLKKIKQELVSRGEEL